MLRVGVESFKPLIRRAVDSRTASYWCLPTSDLVLVTGRFPFHSFSYYWTHCRLWLSVYGQRFCPDGHAYATRQPFMQPPPRSRLSGGGGLSSRSRWQRAIGPGCFGEVRRGDGAAGELRSHKAKTDHSRNLVRRQRLPCAALSRRAASGEW